MNTSDLPSGPSSPRSEAALIGGLMLDNNRWDDIADVVTAGDFHGGEHRVLFATLAELAGEGKPFDAVTVAERLERTGKLESAGGLAYLGQVATGAPTAANVETYARTVRDLATLRRLARACGDGLALVHESGRREPAAVAAEIEAAIFAAVAHRGDAGLKATSALVPMALADLDRRSASDGGLAGLTTGLADLDRGLSGLEPGQLVLIGARPAIGKSALAMGFALNAAVREERPVALFSLEMSAAEIMQRAVASLGAIPLHRLRSARLDADQWAAVNRTSARLAAAPLHVDDSGGLTCPELRARCRRLKRQAGDLALVVVDYLQLMGGDSRAETRTLELGNITRQLKILAKEIGAPVVALSQLNRGLENRSNRRPMLADLRESGNLEQDADVVLLLYRDEVYNNGTSDTGTAEIIIAKQRNGPVGTVRAAFRGEFARFDNLAFPR